MNWFSFPFEIVPMPFFDSNIPMKTFQFFIVSEILGLARNTSDYLDASTNNTCINCYTE